MRAEKVIENLELAREDYLSSSLSLRNLCIKHNIPRGMISGYFLGKGIDIYSRKSKVNNLLFEKIDTEEKAYWLGFLYADGSVSFDESRNINRVELTLKESDYEHLVKFAKFLDYDRTIKYREKVKAYRLAFSSKSMCEDLIKLGCIPTKSLVLKFPTEEQVSSDLMNHFIRGYFEGDGCLSLSTLSVTFHLSILGTKEFLTGICNLFELDNNRILKKDKRHLNNTFYIQFTVKDGLNLLNYMYKDAIIFLDRKRELYTEMLLKRSLSNSKVTIK